MADLGVRYATALFQLSEERGQLDVIMEQSKFICSTFEGEEGALRILTHPLISANEKNDFVEKVYGAVIHPDLLGLMKLAIAKNREAFLLSALTKLVDMIMQHQNYRTARVVSAVPLNESQLLKLTDILSAKLGKKVAITAVVDSSAIAGISVHVDGYFLDRTVKTMLKNMNESLRSASQ